MVFKTKSNLNRHKNTHEKGRKVVNGYKAKSEAMEFQGEEEDGNQLVMSIVDTNIRLILSQITSLLKQIEVENKRHFLIPLTIPAVATRHQVKTRLITWRQSIWSH